MKLLKKLICFVLCLVMLLTLMPATILKAEAATKSSIYLTDASFNGSTQPFGKQVEIKFTIYRGTNTSTALKYYVKIKDGNDTSYLNADDYVGSAYTTYLTVTIPQTLAPGKYYIYAYTTDNYNSNAIGYFYVGDDENLHFTDTLSGIQTANSNNLSNPQSAWKNTASTYQKYSSDDPIKYELQLKEMYIGALANAIVEYESSANDDPTDSQQWILMRWTVKNTGGDVLECDRILGNSAVCPLYSQSGAKVAFSDYGWFSRDRENMAPRDIDLYEGASADVWIAYLIPKSVGFPLIQISTGYSNGKAQIGWLDTTPVIPAPTITKQPASVSAFVGDTVNFSVVAKGRGLTYRWQQLKTTSGSWETISGETSSSLSVIAYANRNGRKYRCVISNSAGTVTSNAATLTVIAAPTITSQPKSVTVALGDTAVFSVTATGTGLSYKWQQKKVGGAWETMAGETAASVNVIGYANREGRQYRCVVSNGSGSVTSNAATLHINTHSGCPCAHFVDMPPYGTPEHEAIDWAYTHNPKITSGMDDTHFGTGQTLTRAQASTFLYAGAGKPVFNENAAVNPFSDVPAGKWYTKAVLWAASEGLVAGYDGGVFKPNATLTRGQIIAILYAWAGKPSVSGKTNPYSDVPAGKWYTSSAIWAYYEGIEKGTDGKYNQSMDCTREAFVVYLYRYLTGNGLVE